MIIWRKRCDPEQASGKTSLHYGRQGRPDQISIAQYIARESGNRALAKQFADRLRRKCAELAALPFSMGRPRPELRPDMRSVAFGNYVIFFRYLGNTLEVVNILEGHRDIGGFFSDENR